MWFLDFDETFGVMHKMEDAGDHVYVTLYSKNVLKRLRELEGDGKYEVSKTDGGDWVLVPNDDLSELVPIIEVIHPTK